MRISDWSSDVCSSDLSHRIPCWVAGWGSGPVPPRKSLFRDFPNSLSAALSGAIEIDRRTDERFQRLLVDRVAFMDIDRAAAVAVEARLEQPGRIGARSALGAGHLDVGLVGLAGADHAVAIPDGNAAPLPFLD